MVNKFKIFLLAFFSLLFLLPSITYADTITYSIPQSVVDLTFDKLDTLKSTAENWLSTQHTVGGYSQYYLIIYRPSNNSVWLYFYSYADEQGNVYKGNSYVNYSTDTNYNLHFRYSGTMYHMRYNDDFTGFTSNPISSTNQFIVDLYNERFLLYFNFDLKYIGSQDLLFTYGDQSYLYSNNSSYNKTFISVSELLTHFNFDPYPLLTSFFTIVFDSLILTTEYFTSNYILLTIFVIFLFYFIILLFRRLS